MTSPPRVLTSEELAAISNHVDFCYKFDLSRISTESYVRLIRTLDCLAVDSLTGLGFSLDLLEQTKLKARRIQQKGSRGDKLAAKRAGQLPSALTSAVFSHKKDLMQDLASFFARVLPRTSSLTFLKFRSLPLRAPEIDLIATGIYQCASLRSLRFCGVTLGDDGFRRLARALRRRAITDLQLRSCQLTDKCGRDLHALLSFHVFVQSEAAWVASLSGSKQQELVCLHTLDLRDNEFTYQFIDEIQDVILDLPVTVVDFRGNAGISESVLAKLVRKLRESGRNTEIRFGPSKLIKQVKPRTIVSSASRPPALMPLIPAVKKTREARIQELEEENAILKNLIKQLNDGDNVVELEPGLTIVGAKAAEFVEHINRLDAMLPEYAAAAAPFAAKKGDPRRPKRK
jgi:hypothetical protein